MANIYVGVVGLRLRLTLGIDISAAGDAKIRYEDPSGNNGLWTATIESAGNGIIYYDVTDGDLNAAGIWKFNGVWDPTGDNIFYGKTVCFHVKALGDCE